MKVKWIGHSCFLIISKDGLRIITDPYAIGGGINYPPIKETADVIVVSHEHLDHNNISAVQGKPEVVRGSGIKTARGIQFRGIATYHDNSQGKQRGPNVAFCFILDGIRLCHLGDLGHLLSQAQVVEIGSVDMLFIPIGGSYTIDANGASQVCNQLGPKTIIPMHFKTPECTYPIAGVDDFLKGKRSVRRTSSSEAEFELEKLPDIAEVVILKPTS